MAEDIEKQRMIREQIDVLRRTAHAQLDVAAKLEFMLAAGHFASSGASSTPAHPIKSSTEATLARAIFGSGSSTGQLPRGMPRAIVQQYMSELGKRVISQIEILADLKKTQKIKMGQTTLRRALDALEEEGLIERVPGTKAWRSKANVFD